MLFCSLLKQRLISCYKYNIEKTSLNMVESSFLKCIIFLHDYSLNCDINNNKQLKKYEKEKH